MINYKKGKKIITILIMFFFILLTSVVLINLSSREKSADAVSATYLVTLDWNSSVPWTGTGGTMNVRIEASSTKVDEIYLSIFTGRFKRAIEGLSNSTSSTCQASFSKEGEGGTVRIYFQSGDNIASALQYLDWSILSSPDVDADNVSIIFGTETSVRLNITATGFDDYLPKRITQENFSTIRTMVNEAGISYDGWTLYLDEDIRVTGSGLGTYYHPFNGSISGNGYTVSGGNLVYYIGQSNTSKTYSDICKVGSSLINMSVQSGTITISECIAWNTNLISTGHSRVTFSNCMTINAQLSGNGTGSSSHSMVVYTNDNYNILMSKNSEASGWGGGWNAYSGNAGIDNARENGSPLNGFPYYDFAGNNTLRIERYTTDGDRITSDLSYTVLWGDDPDSFRTSGDSIYSNKANSKLGYAWVVDTNRYTYEFSHFEKLSDYRYRAYFKAIPVPYSVTFRVATSTPWGSLTARTETFNDVGYGSILTFSGDTISISYSNSSSSQNTVYAIPNSSTVKFTYSFDKWTYDIGRGERDVSSNLTIETDTTITAYFERAFNTYDLTLSVTSSTETSSNDKGGNWDKTEAPDLIYGTDIKSSRNTLTITKPNDDDMPADYVQPSDGRYTVTTATYGYTFSRFQYRRYSGGSWSSWTDLDSNLEITSDTEIRAVFSLINYDMPHSFIANSSGTSRSIVNTFDIESRVNVYSSSQLYNSLTTTEKNYLNNIGKSFGYWIINVSGGRVVGNTSYSAYASGGTLTVSGPAGNWKFRYSESVIGLIGNTYYQITSLDSGSYGDLPSGILNAKWSNTYDVEITNNPSATYWNANSDTDYLGVWGTGEVSKVSNTELNFTVKNNGDYRYSFMTSRMNNTYLPFYKRNQITASLRASSNVGSYYLYNYGYEITDWTIQFTYGSTTYYLYPTWNGWAHQSSYRLVAVEDLVSNNMNDMALYAERLDDLLGFDQMVRPTISMFPTWRATTINIQSSGSGSSVLLSSTNYGSTYTFNDSTALLRSGKSIIYYLTTRGSENIIVPGDGITIYNYRNLTYDQYSTNSNAYTYVVYTLYVEPYYVDNVYRVNLNGVRNKDGVYSVEGSDYALTNTTSYAGNTYTYRNFGYTSYSQNISNYKFIEDYADNVLSPYRAEYENEISNGTLAPLRNIYGSNGNFYIYLANEQQTGNLPTFRTDYFTLIFWINDNTSTSGRRYIYKTTEYDVTVHAEETSNYAEHTDAEAGIWMYTDGGTNKTVDSMTAFYFRKNYNLDVSTVLDGVDGRYGYVVIEFIDRIADQYAGAENTSGRYLAIYNNDSHTMEYYIYPSGDTLPIDLSILTRLTNANTNLPTAPVLYAGCDFVIDFYDQSQDTTAANSGYYDTMIGYRFANATASNPTSTEGELFVDLTSYSSGVIDMDVIENQNCDTNSTYNITVNFAYILYDMLVEMGVGDNSAGTFRVTYPNGAISPYVISLNVTDMIVNSVYYITYNAYTGYEYDENAYTFTLPNGRVLVMQTSEHWENTGEQYYVLNMTSEWLRTNYYNFQDLLYQVANTHLGTIDINTQEIEFEYKVKVYDSSKTDESAWLAEIDMYTWSLKDESVNLTKAFSPLSIGGYGYIHNDANNTEYAILSSYVYEPRNPASIVRQYRAYDFLCLTQPDEEIMINGDLLSYMVIYTTYEIVPIENRTIYMTINVREIFEIDVLVQRLDHDTNSTTRTVVISNSTNNTEEIVLGNQASVSGGYYTTRGLIYTYNGLMNTIESTYDDSRYEGVEYYLNDVLLEGDTLSVDRDSQIVVRFLPKALGVEVRYELDGEPTTLENLSGILTNFVLMGDSEVYVGSILELRYSVHSDYNIRVEINGKELFGYAYIVQDDDYDSGVVEIVVKINMQPNDVVSFRFALSDSTKALAGDDYGEMTAYVNGEAEDELENIRVIEGRSVEVRLDLNTGYAYYGYKQNNSGINTSSITNNVLVVTDSFDLILDSGEYTIYVSKQDVTATFNQPDTNSKNYTIEGGEKMVTDDSTQIIGLYVGRTITFNRLKDLETETLRHYYYVNSSNQRIAIDGNELTITSELLDEVGSLDIRLGVETINKYRLVIELIRGIDYAIVETDVPIIEGLNSIYFEEGSEILVTISTIVEGKYTITTSGDLNKTADRIEELIVLDSDKTIQVSVTAKTYNVQMEEYVYTSIDELENENPSVENDPVSDTALSGQNYSELGEISFNKESTSGDRVITKVILTETGKDSLIIDVYNGIYTISSSNLDAELEITEIDTGYSILLNGKVYTIQDLGSRLQISYMTEDNVNIRLEYTAIKEIRP